VAVESLTAIFFVAKSVGILGSCKCFFSSTLKCCESVELGIKTCSSPQVQRQVISLLKKTAATKDRGKFLLYREIDDFDCAEMPWRWQVFVSVSEEEVCSHHIFVVFTRSL
jgi:hypothetical protein